MALWRVTLLVLLFGEGMAVCFSAPWHVPSKAPPKGLQRAERFSTLCTLQPDLKFGVHVLRLGAESRRRAAQSRASGICSWHMHGEGKYPELVKPAISWRQARVSVRQLLLGGAGKEFPAGVLDVTLLSKAALWVWVRCRQPWLVAARRGVPAPAPFPGQSFPAIDRAWKCVRMMSGRNGSIAKSLFLAGTK